MHLDGHRFLVTLVGPLQLTLQTLLKNEMADQLGLGLKGQLSLLRSRGFQPTVVHMDPQTGFQAIKNLFPGVLIDDSGAADNAPKVNVKIRHLKEIYRAVKNGLLWNLPVSLVKYLVGYAVGRMKIRSRDPHRLFFSSVSQSQSVKTPDQQSQSVYLTQYYCTYCVLRTLQCVDLRS
jgi:hypothetical protein